MENDRLSRMEEKIAKFSAVVIARAALKVFMVTVFKRLNTIDVAWKKYTDRMDELERKA